jgi:2-isopropylmalate synthase
MSDKILIFDTTLRDGEQCPGASMNTREKLEVARQLARLKVDIIEAGFPIASDGDFEAVKAIASEIQGPCIAALARTIEKDIVRAGEAIALAPKRRIHTFSSGSDIHLKTMLNVSREENIKRSVKAVQLARQFTDNVEYSAQDTTRSDRDYLVDLYTACAEAGATTLNIPDTVGYAIPGEFGALIAFLVERVKVPGVIFSVHCHDDLGLAVANSLAAVQAGARQIECTINGLGERAGNTSLEEVVMALKMRPKIFGGLTTGIDTHQLYPASRLVSHLTGMVVQRNKAIIGENAFAHESGIHQHGVLKDRSNYEIMRAEDVGRTSELTWGKHMGHHAVGKKLAEMGYQLSADEIHTVTEKIKVLADKKKAVYDEDVRAIVEGEFSEVPPIWKLNDLTVVTGKTPKATVTMTRTGKKDPLTSAGTGDGPIDAMLKTIDRITGTRGSLVDYNVASVTKGKDAIGEVSVRVQFAVPGGASVPLAVGPRRIVTGKGASTDIIEASALAYLNALNRYLDEQRRRAETDKPTL